MSGAKKIKRLRRKVNMGEAASSQNKAESVRVSQENQIRKHQRYDIIVSAIQEGISCQEIARWFAKEGWIDVNERTFSQYLQTFKRRNPFIAKGGDADSIDSLVDAHRPDVDTLTELNRLLRVQKKRLKVDIETEINMGKLFNSTHKEIEATRNILETMAKVQGRIGKSGDISAEVDSGQREAIRVMKTDENQRDRMYTLTDELVKVMENASGSKTSVSTKT